MRQYAASAWRGRARTHEACAAVGLTLPGRNVWHPRATMLFLTPREVLLPPALALTADESDALEQMMAA
jgi:hypothetical protein